MTTDLQINRVRQRIRGAERHCRTVLDICDHLQITPLRDVPVGEVLEYHWRRGVRVALIHDGTDTVYSVQLDRIEVAA